MAKRKAHGVTTILSSLITVVLIVGAVGGAVYLTNGFTSAPNPLSLWYGDKPLIGATDVVFPFGEEIRIDLKYAFWLDKFMPDKTYAVNILPNGAEDFAYTVNARAVSYSAAEDLTESFNVAVYESYFTLFIYKDIIELLEPKHAEGSEISVPSRDYSLLEYFTLTVAASSATINVNFKTDVSIRAKAITLNKAVVVW